MSGDEDADTVQRSKWSVLERAWNRVVTQEDLVGSRTGVWKVQKEYSGEGLGPIAGEFDEIAVYHGHGAFPAEVGRWQLEEVAEYV